MDCIATIANVPQHLFWSTVDESFTLTCKGLRILIYLRSA